MLAATADDVAQIIEALADLLWPVLAFVAVVLFRKELAELSKRIKRLRAGGVEADLDKALDDLQATAQEAAEPLPRFPLSGHPTFRSKLNPSKRSLSASPSLKTSTLRQRESSGPPAIPLGRR